MLLNQLVRINEMGLVANAVSFELMDDPDKNLRLCQGFVFNYDSDPKKLKSSTVGVLDALRRSFHSPNEPNIHLMVQDYGKGKSHFALAVANFFKKPYDSPEVQGVLQQVEYATSSTNPTVEGLRLFKQRGRHLVICLSGDKPIDLKKHFLQALRKALESEGITDSIAQQICKQPLQYLESLDARQREAAEAFLERIGNPEGDLNTIMQLLRDDNYQVIPRVKEICRQLTGVTPDFEADVDVEALLTDLITRLCTGANPHFRGILILFDELYNYLQSWANDPVRAGSTTLQNITNICERYKGRIALISFTQRKLSRVIPPKHVEDYNRLVSRLELLPSTYEPATSLELVLDGLLSQQDKTAAWQEFRARWDNTLRADSAIAYENRTASYYRSRNWSFQKFHDHITIGCFPLYPLTSYLLCNLNFTQGRTAIQFVQNDVKNFISEQPVEKDGRLNYTYPVALVDAFESNFSNPESNPEYPRLFSDYSYAANKIKTSADAAQDELTVLKAIFLFYASASGNKLAKPDREKHEDILSLLTGLSVAKVKATLDKCQHREVIYHNPASNTYQFYSGGIDPDALRRRIGEETANIQVSLNRVETYCQVNIAQYVGNDTLPTQFVEENRLRTEDWRFQNKVYTIARFRKALFSDQTLRDIDASGIVAYVIAETTEELLELRNEINQLLVRSPIKGQVVVAISSQPAGNIARLLLELETAKRKSVQEFGAALTQLQQQYQKQIDDSISDLFKSCTYHCYILEKIPTGDRSNPSRIISAVLQDRYPFVPPIQKLDKLALKSTTGSQVIGYASKRLLEDDLRPQAFPKQSYANTIDPVFVETWGLLKKASQKYSIQVPTQRNVKAAWDKISEMTALGDQTERTIEIAENWRVLSEPPYGYNEYTFTILFAGWLAYHRSEVFLKGSFGIPQKKSDQVSIRIEPIKNWATTNVLDKPKDFIYEWVLNKAKPQLIRRKPLPCPEVPNRVDYEQARQFIQEIDNFLSGTPDPAKVNEITKTRQGLTTSVERIDERFELVSRAENILRTSMPGQADIDPLVQLYSDLQQPLAVIVEDGLSVSPTEQQQRQRLQASQAVIERIGQAVQVQSDRFKSLLTEADCGAYKANIQRLIAQISQVNDLPPRFVNTLQDALRAADSTLAEIVEQRKVQDCLSQIQRLYNTLSDLATQHEYVRIQTEIEKLVEGVPAARDTDTYRNTIQSLEEKQDALIRQVADWESQYSPTISRNQAVRLSQNINRELNRYTDEPSQQRLHELLSHLGNIIFERKSEEHQKRLQDMQTMQSIRQHTLVKANTIHLCEEGIVAIERLRNELNYPEQFTSEIDNFFNEFRNKIVTYNKNMQNLRDRLSSTETYKQLGSIQDEYAKLDLIFKDSTAYPTYQQLQEQIRLLGEDWELIHNLESRYQQSNSIAACDDALELISNEQVNLHDLGRFRSKLLQLEDHLRRRRQSYIEQLNEIQDKLSGVKTLKEAQRVQRELANKLTYYRESQEEERYEAIGSEVSLLLSLLQISETQKLETVQDCQAELERLSQWRDATEGITPTVQARLDSIIQRLEQTKQQILELQKRTATAWLESLENQDVQLEQITDSPKKLDAASQLLSKLRKQRHQHEEMLETEQKQILEFIINHCVEIQNQDRESKILVLFQELPHEQRENLLKRLAECVSGTMEEFNG